MQSAPASFRRRTDQTSSRSGRRPAVSGVVAGLLVGEQEALAVAMLRGGQAELGVEQDGGGVLAEDVGDERLELFQIMAGGGSSALFGEGLLQRAALVHGGGGDNAARVGDGLQACEFSGCQLHGAMVSWWGCLALNAS